jgi:predicted alpha/beta superfamily hydrolase
VKTTIEVDYPDANAALGLRGSVAPLSWEATTPPTAVTGARRLFEVDVPAAEVLEFKVMRGDAWSRERNYSVVGGETCRVRPHFERDVGRLLAPGEVASPELARTVTYQVFLPPSYDEHEGRRYPTLYAQDGHVVFRTGDDFGAPWSLDATLDELYRLGAIEEVIVVGVHTQVGRLEMMTPSRDARYGGGDAPRYLAFLVDTLKPLVDAAYRTQPACKSTAILGASLGGLFAFFAAWRRSDVFGKAACLSSSFWWDDRFMVRDVRDGACPVPRPLLYIDSGASQSEFDEDANRRDGYHHTVAMRNALVGHCYEAGVHVHMLAFAGATHDNAAWAARLATPLQLLFPREAAIVEGEET